MTQTRRWEQKKRRQWIKSDKHFSEVRQTTKLTKGKRESIYPKGEHEPTRRTKTKYKGKIMEIKENRENQEINRSTEETNHLVREKEG